MMPLKAARPRHESARPKRVAGIFRFGLIPAFLIGFFSVLAIADTAAAQACGSPGQRACCIAEASFGACVAGAIEVPQPNSGLCGGFNPLGIQSSGVCVAVTPCGGANQRACCLGEASFGACRSGLLEEPRANSGFCGNLASGIQSSGICRQITPCGGPGERACCLGEASFGACESGTVEVPRANSGQCGNLAFGIQSSGVCETVTPCGGAGERACCVGEAGFGACESGLIEVPQANSGFCGGSVLGIQSSGVCEIVTPCGREGQRACCVGEASFGACEDGLNERPEPNSGFCGGSILGIQSSGVCQAASALGEACGPLFQCEEGLFCDPFAGFTCVDSGGVDDACGPLVPCEDGLQCTLGLRCSEEPAQNGQKCDLTAPCAEGLFCQAGSQRCRELKRPGEGCSAFNPCIDGASCDPCLVEGCSGPLTCNLNANEGAITEAACRAIYSPDLAAAARDIGVTMIYGAGNEIAGLIGESQTFGVAYGQNEEYGCFTTLCGGINADVSIEFFATIGFYEDFELVRGASFANFQEVEIAGVLNFATAQVFAREGLLPLPELIGTEDSFGLGISPDLLPFSAGSFICETVLDQVIVIPDMSDMPAISSRPASVVANGGARFSLESWNCSDPELCERSEDDAFDVPSSGSGEVSSPASSGPDAVATLAAPCVSILPEQAYELQAQVKTIGVAPGLVRAVWYEGLACDTQVVRTDEFMSSPPDDTWRGVDEIVSAPSEAQSVALELVAANDPASALVSTSRLDAVTISPTMAATDSGGGGDDSGGGGGGCGLIGIEPFLVLAGIRFGRIARRRHQFRNATRGT